MALPYQLVVKISDGDDTATTSLHVPTGFTLAQYGEFAQSMGGLINDLTLGVINGSDLCIGVSTASLSDNTESQESDREEYGSFKFLTDEGRDLVVNVPMVSDEKTINNLSDALNDGDADVSAFITAMVAGISVTGGTIAPCDVGEDSVASNVWARERFRNSGKRR